MKLNKPKTLFQLKQSSTDCTVWSNDSPVITNEHFQKNFRPVENSTNVWDNGRDWRNPSAKEGGWIRIFPLTCSKMNDGVLAEANYNSEKEIKNIVMKTQKYYF